MPLSSEGARDTRTGQSNPYTFLVTKENKSAQLSRNMADGRNTIDSRGVAHNEARCIDWQTAFGNEER